MIWAFIGGYLIACVTVGMPCLAIMWKNHYQLKHQKDRMEAEIGVLKETTALAHGFAQRNIPSAAKLLRDQGVPDANEPSMAGKAMT